MSLRGYPNPAAIAELEAKGFEPSTLSSADPEATFEANVANSGVLDFILTWDLGSDQDIAFVKGALVKFYLVDSGSAHLPRATQIAIYKSPKNEKWPRFLLFDSDYSPWYGKTPGDMDDADVQKGLIFTFKQGAETIIGGERKGYNIVRRGWVVQILVKNTGTAISTSNSLIEIDVMKRTVS